MLRVILVVAMFIIPFGVFGYKVEALANAQQPVSPSPTPVLNDSGIRAPYQNAPQDLLPATVIGDAWLQITPVEPTKSFQFYMLRFGDRVYVDVESQGYYLIWWYFDSNRDPMLGWAKKDLILLDRDVRYE